MGEKITLKDFMKITEYGYKIDISKYINKKITYRLNMKNIFNMIDDEIKENYFLFTSIKNVKHLKYIFKYKCRLRKKNVCIGNVWGEDIFVSNSIGFVGATKYIIKDCEIIIFKSNCLHYESYSTFINQIERQQKLDFIETL